MTVAHSFQIYLSVKILNFRLVCHDTLCTGFVGIRISRKSRVHAMRVYSTNVLRRKAMISLTSSDHEISVHQIFGRNLRELCKRIGTIAEVADHLGVNRVQMNRILNGESFPKPGLMKRVCDHFSVNARILFGAVGRA